MSMFDDIVAFHEKFGLSPSEYRYNDELVSFRLGFMKEELQEFVLSVHEKNDIETIDALVDLCYVAMGTAYMMGFDFNKAWKIVHDSNMKKVRANSSADSKRKSSLDVVKPAGWIKPDLKECI